MNNQLVFTSIRQLSKLVKSRQVSPVELSELFLDRLEQRAPSYNALVTLTRERASRQAARAEREIAAGNYKGPLHGIPWGAKDLLATSDGIPTTWGAEPFRRSEEHTSELQSRRNLVCRLLLEKKKQKQI